MKIGIVHLNLTTESGDPRMALSLGVMLQDLGHAVIIYTAGFDSQRCFPKLSSQLDIRSVEASAPLFGNRPTPQGVFGKVFERLRQWRLESQVIGRIAAAMDADFDVLVFQNDASYKIGLRYKARHPHARGKTVWIMHNPPFYHSQKPGVVTNLLSKLRAAWEHREARRYAKGIDVVMTYDREKAAAAQALGVPVVNREGIPVDFEDFYLPLKPKSFTKGVSLLSVGALSPSRGFEDTVKAVALLRSKGYDVRATIVCKDFWGDHDYRKQFERFIANSGVAGFIDARFQGANELELREIFRNCDFFVFPSTIKIWGMTVFEAMASGLPAIVADGSSVVEVLEDGVDAMFVPRRRPDMIAERIADMIEHPVRFEALRMRAQTIVKEKLNWKRYANLIIQ